MSIVEQMVEILESAIEQEVQNYEDGSYDDLFGEGADADNDPVIEVLREAVDELQSALFQPTEQWIEQLSTKIYDATSEGSMYGDTDLADGIADELFSILG